MSKSKSKLGRYLEWHGNRIRVVVRVPNSLTATVGVTKLREPLTTADPMEAEREKVEVVRRLKAKLRGEKVSVIPSPLTEEAMGWREAVQQADIGQGNNEPDVVRSALSDRVHRVQAQHGPNMAQTFAAVATGTATPLAALLDRWFAEMSFSVGYMADIRRAVERLETWCKETVTPVTIEAIKTAIAGRFIHDRYIALKVDVKTANKDISSLHSYWEFLGRRHGIKDNSWTKQRLRERQTREQAASGEKRAFTDEEVRTLLGGIRLRREWEFSLFAAVSGLRVHEIAGLRVKHCADGKVAVVKSKTPSGVRTIPRTHCSHPLSSAGRRGSASTTICLRTCPSKRPARSVTAPLRLANRSLASGDGSVSRRRGRTSRGSRTWTFTTGDGGSSAAP
jgi:integrase